MSETEGKVGQGMGYSPDTLDDWRDNARPFFAIKPLTDPNEFVGQAQFRRVGPLVVNRVRFSPQRMEHDPSRLKDFDHDYLLFERYRSGCGRGLVGDDPTKVDPEVMHLVDMSRHYVTMTSGVLSDGVIIPHSAVGYDPSQHPAYVSVACDSEKGRLLGLALDALCAEPVPDNDTEDLSGAFATLVRKTLLGQSDDPDETAERGRALLLHAYIRRHLGDLTLDADRMCRELGLSRATLYRLLADQGGVRNHITDLRLERCFADLLRSTPQRGLVRKVAENWGFFDPANFHHGFRRRFGFSPSDCLEPQGSADAGAGGRNEGPVASILDWVTRV